VLEVFDAARHAQQIALNLSLYCSEGGFGYALWIGRSAGRKTGVPEAVWEHKRVGCMMRGTLRDACLSFLLAWESAKRERGYAWKSVDMC